MGGLCPEFDERSSDSPPENAPKGAGSRKDAARRTYLQRPMPPPRTLLPLVVFAASQAACAPQKPPVAPVYAEAEQGPRLAPWLELSADQRDRIVALVEGVKRDVKPVEPAAMGLADGVASALRGCRTSSTMLEMRADSLVRSAEAARGPILDAVNELHAILTPKQRRRLVQHVLERERTSSPDARREETDDTTTSVGVEIDLSWRQIASILVRARKIQSVYEDKAEPWLERYRSAVRAFAEPRFAVYEHPIAKAPVMRMAADLVTDAYRVLVPLLEPEQCDALSDYLRGKLAELEAQAEERAAKESHHSFGAPPD